MSTNSVNDVAIGYLTNKTQLAHQLLISLQFEAGNKDEDKERFKIFPVTSKARLIELLQKYKLDLVIIEEEFIDDDPSIWLGSLNTVVVRSGFDKVPFVLCTSAEKKPADIRYSLNSGFVEILAKPVDMPILLQTINRLTPMKSVLKAPTLYKMPTNCTISVGTPLTLETLSETEVVIVSETPFYPGDIVSLYAEAFMESQLKEVVARCATSYKPLGQDRYKSTFNLQNVTPDLSKSIRKWISLSSAQDKQRFG